LWGENRVMITVELLERFGSLRVRKRTGVNFNVVSVATEPDDIPMNITEFTIEFVNAF